MHQNLWRQFVTKQIRANQIQTLWYKYILKIPFDFFHKIFGLETEDELHKKFDNLFQN